MVAALVITGLAACQKESVTLPDGEAETNDLAEVKVGTSPRVYPKFYDLLALGIVECMGEGGNCLPEVVVSRSRTAAMDAVWEAIISGDRARITSTFQGNATMLAEFMQPSHRSGVMNGTYQATGTAAVPGRSPERYLKISRAGELIAVYPLKNAPR